VKFSDNVRITIIPRKLTCNLKGDYTWRRDREYDETLADWTPTRYKVFSGEFSVKYSVTSRLSFSLPVQVETVFDENIGGENYFLFASGFFGALLF
jgi:hypothetical protein